MRYLHPVQMHEKFVASGRYAHYRQMLMDEDRIPYWQQKGVVDLELYEDLGDGERFYHGLLPDAWAEEWTIHELPDQSRLIRCDRYVRHDPAESFILGEILQRADGAIERIDLRCYDESQLILEATYLFFAESVLIGRRHLPHGNSRMTEREQFEQPVPAGYIADAGLFTISRSIALQQIFKQQQATGQTYTPHFYPGRWEYEDLDIVISSWLRGKTDFFYNIRVIREATVKIQGRPLTGVIYFWEEHDTVLQDFTAPDPGVDFVPSKSFNYKATVIDRHDIALRYALSSVDIDRLEQYAHRPEPKPRQDS